MDTFQKYNNNGLTGLANLGNTCFLNTVLQCLSHTYELNDYLKDISSNFRNSIHSNKIESIILIEWKELLELMWSKNCIISPKKFIHSTHKVASKKDRDIFTGFAQNDLPEFLLFILDCFHESLSKKVDIHIIGEPKNEIDELALDSYKATKQLFENEYSKIIDLFYGNQYSTLSTVDDTKVINRIHEPFGILNLPIPSNFSKVHIYDCFNEYTKIENLGEDNKWKDEHGEYHVIKKQIKFFNLPKILIIDLKRFFNDGRKNNMFVDFEIDNLDLSKYVNGYNKHTAIYELYGICNHIGSNMGGHYYGYIKNANKKWYEFNDTNVSEIDTSKIKTNRAYCLFYRKKQL